MSNMTSVSKLNVELNRQAIEIIYNVYRYFKEEMVKFQLNSDYQYFTKIRKRLNQATGVPAIKLRKLLVPCESQPTPVPSTSYKVTGKKVQFKPTKSTFSKTEDDYYIVRKIINEITLNGWDLTSAKDSFKTLQDSLNYKAMTIDEWKKVLNKMGFERIKIQNTKTTFMMEKPEVRLKRIEYLDRIKELRAAGKNIVFIGESVIYTSANQSDCWIIVNAGNKDGFIGPCLYYKWGNEVNSEIYNVWLLTQIIPNLSKESVLVFENGPLRNKFGETYPPFYTSTKQEMIEWLQKRSISVDPLLTKPQIHDIICHYKEALFKNKIDQILGEHGHLALRLPLYYPELNPIEKVWQQVGKVLLLKKTGVKELRESRLVDEAIKERMSMIKSEQWKEVHDETIDCEEYYRSLEYDLDEFTDNLNCSSDDLQNSDSESDDAEQKLRENSLYAETNTNTQKNIDVGSSNVPEQPQEESKEIVILLPKPKKTKYAEGLNKEILDKKQKENNESKVPVQCQKTEVKKISEFQKKTTIIVLTTEPKPTAKSNNFNMEVAENIAIGNEDTGDMTEEFKKKPGSSSSEELIIKTEVDDLENYIKGEIDNIDKVDIANIVNAFDQAKEGSSGLILTEELNLKPEVVEYSDEEMSN